MDNATLSSQYLTFHLDEEMFALDIAQVREVLDYTRITWVPRMPDYMRGVINLRGGVVPVIDLKNKFKLSLTERGKNSCIVIVEVLAGHETTVIGALADSVEEVIEITPSMIEPPPRVGTNLDTDFIRGLARHDNIFIIILDIDRVFSAVEIEGVMEPGRHVNMGQGQPCPDQVEAHV